MVCALPSKQIRCGFDSHYPLQIEVGLVVVNTQADAQSRHNQANCKDDDRRQVGNTSHDRVVIEQNGESGGSYTAEIF